MKRSILFTILLGCGILLSNSQSFKTINDVWSYLSGRIFKNGNVTVRICPQYIEIDGQPCSGAPTITNIGSNSAIITATFPMLGNQKAKMVLNSSNGTLTQGKDIFYSSNNEKTSQNITKNKSDTKKDISWLEGNWMAPYPNTGHRVKINGSTITVLRNGLTSYTGQYTIEEDMVIYKNKKG